MIVQVVVSVIICDKNFFAFLGHFSLFEKGNQETAFNVTDISVHLPKLSFDVTFNFLSLSVKKIEYSIFDLEMVL